MSKKERILMSDDPHDPLYRLRVADERDDAEPPLLITIAEEDLSSDSPNAQVTNVRGAVDLTTDMALFVQGALTDLLIASGDLMGKNTRDGEVPVTMRAGDPTMGRDFTGRTVVVRVYLDELFGARAVKLVNWLQACVYTKFRPPLPMRLYLQIIGPVTPT